MGTAPVFLMDDPFAELDARRSERIVELLADAGLGQVFFAVPRETDIPRGYAALPSARVHAGTIAMREMA